MPDSPCDDLPLLRRMRDALERHALVAETTPDGTITYANDAFCAITGYTREEILGQNPRVLNSGHHPREFFTELWATVSTGQIWHGEICNRHKDGSLFWRDTTIVPNVSATGQTLSFFVIGYDAPAAAKGLGLHLHIAEDVPDRLLGDAPRLRQILTHLIDNAVKFTAHGEVRVTLSRQPAASPPSLLFSIQDTGCGIPADHLDRLFQRFFQGDTSTTRAFGGTGLGLTRASAPPHPARRG